MIVHDSSKPEKASVIWSDVSTPCKRLVKTVYFSSCCRCIYIFLLLCTCGLGIWAGLFIVRGKRPHWTYYLSESCVNLVLVVDVMMRQWIKGCYKYWREYTNICEFVLVWICGILTVLSITDLELITGKYDEIVDISIMIGLCTFQSIRAIFFIAKQQQTKVMQILM